MADYLIRKQTGYNTCCPDEENTVGYYKFKDPDNVEVYTRPSYDSETYNKVLDRIYSNKKYWSNVKIETLLVFIKIINNLFCVQTCYFSQI